MNNYDIDYQKHLLSFMLLDAQSFTRVQNIFNEENFSKPADKVAKFIKNHVQTYTILPTMEQIKLETGVELSSEKVDLTQVNWFLDTFEKFTRQKSLERAISKAADMLESNDFDPIEKLIKDALHISLTKDLGVNCFDDPKAILTMLKSNNGQNSTGWPTLDKLLYGGFNRGELQIFAGSSGSGKSLFMQNISANWARAGLNGCYITLELSEGLCCFRLYSILTDMPCKEIFKESDDVELKMKMLQRSSGRLQMKYMPAQSTVNDIRAYVKELQLKTGKPIDFLCVDYLDLLMPVSAKVSPNDLYVKDKYVSEELRNLAKELNVLFVTASQLNRSAVEQSELDHSHISGGISKINTADNVFGIFTSRSFREQGRYQIQLMKTRSSAGVGRRIELGFDVDSLKIYDIGETDQPKVSSTDILSKIKPNVAINPPRIDHSTTPDVDSNKVKGLLSEMLRPTR